MGPCLGHKAGPDGAKLELYVKNYLTKLIYKTFSTATDEELDYTKPYEKLEQPRTAKILRTRPSAHRLLTHVVS